MVAREGRGGGRRGRGGGEGRGRGGRGRGRQVADIKSNNPHLTGGEKQLIDF